MSAKLDQLDYYTLLGIADEAPIPEVKRAFRKFARRYHPDRFAGAAADKIEQAAKIYRRGSEAFQVLTDPEARKAYDRALARGRTRLTAEERDRAGRAQVEVPVKKAQPIKSPQALAYFKQGVEAAHDGDWRKCWRYLKAARESEPGNEIRQTRFDDGDRRRRQG